jgi:HSP20 family protein
MGKKENNVYQSDNLFNGFFNWGSLQREPLSDTMDVHNDFEDIRREMDTMFNVFNDIPANAPKDLIREYETQEVYGKTGGAGPMVYGYSMTIGPDGKSYGREFGNVKLNTASNIKDHLGNPDLSSEGDMAYDVNTTDKEVKVVLEMPGVKEEDIKINEYDGKVEIKTVDRSQRKYYKIVNLPKEANTETTRFTYNNGILEVIFDKKDDIKPKGKDLIIGLKKKFSDICSIISKPKSKMKH